MDLQGSLNSITGAEIFRLMKKINEEQGTTFLIVTHDSRIAKATQRTIYLKDGVTYNGPTINMDILQY